MTPHLASPGAERRALVVLLAVTFVNIAGFGVVIPLLPFYGQSFHAAAWQVGLLFSVFSFGQFFGESFWGRLSDRIGRRPVLMMTIFGNGLSYLALAFAPNILIACLIRLASGFLSGNISTIQGCLADVTPPAQRAGRMGVLGSAFSLGFMTGPGIGGLLAQPSLGTFGFRLPIFAAALFATLSAIGVVIFVRETFVPKHVDHVQVSRLQSLGEAMRNPVVIRVMIVSLIGVSGFAGIEATYGLWTQSRFGWGPRQIGLCFMLTGGCGALVQGLATGRLVRRFGGTQVLMAGLMLIGVGMTTQGFAPVWQVAVAGLFFVTLGQSLTFPNISGLISQSAPPDRQGEMLGLNMACNALARVVGPVAGSAMFAGINPGAPFIVGALLTLPGMALVRAVGRRVRDEV
jgi:DHA1 family tetracycline resistance protein-like MFS transporter